MTNEEKREFLRMFVVDSLSQDGYNALIEKKYLEKDGLSEKAEDLLKCVDKYMNNEIDYILGIKGGEKSDK